MIDIAYLENIKLRSIPRAQQIIALFLLTPNYHFFSKVVIKIEHIELIPRDDNVIFAMNHTQLKRRIRVYFHIRHRTVFVVITNFSGFSSGVKMLDDTSGIKPERIIIFRFFIVINKRQRN